MRENEHRARKQQGSKGGPALTAAAIGTAAWNGASVSATPL